MRCPEVLDQLPILAYDELDAESARLCHEHLAECPACQAEWQAIRGAMRLLDLAPRKQTQVDLAAICLRIARDQRHGRLLGRWVIGVAAAAAVLVTVSGARLLAFHVEPGRLIVAWNGRALAEPVPPRDPGDAVRPVDAAGLQVVGAGNDPSPAAPINPSETAPRPSADVDFSSSALALRLDGDEPLAWRRLRGLRSFLGTAPASRGASSGTEQVSPSDEPVSYSDLRRHLIDDQQEFVPGAAVPGA